MVATVKRDITPDIVAPVIVLVRPSHPGNIGAVARAMGNMGFSDLRLVNPITFPSPIANARAAGADSILESAKVFDNFDDAIADCRYIIGTTARERTIGWPTLAPAAAVATLTGVTAPEVAFVFGNERSGLANDEVDRCSSLVRIPVNPGYPSMNLGSAVMLIAYEYRMAVLEPRVSGMDVMAGPPQRRNPEAGRLEPATAVQMRGFYRHCEHVLNEIRFLKVHPPTKLMRKILRLFNRARMTEEEVNILRGVLTTIEYELEHRGPRLDLPPEERGKGPLKE